MKTACLIFLVSLTCFAQKDRVPDQWSYLSATGAQSAVCTGDGGGGGGSEDPGGEQTDCNGSDCTTPIVLDLGRDDPRFAGPKTAIFFDLLGSGNPFLMHWVQQGGNEAFLVMDLNHNGVIDDGSELFGQGTRYVNGLTQQKQSLKQTDRPAKRIHLQ